MQEKLEDSGSASGVLPALQAQEQALSSGTAPGVHPPLAGGKGSHSFSSHSQLSIRICMSAGIWVVLIIDHLSPSVSRPTVCVPAAAESFWAAPLHHHHPWGASCPASPAVPPPQPPVPDQAAAPGGAAAPPAGPPGPGAPGAAAAETDAGPDQTEVHPRPRVPKHG